MIRLRWLALWLLLLGALAAWTALRVGQDQTVRSDLLALLPRASEAAPVQPALEHLAASGANRAFLLVTAPNLPQAVSGVDEAVPSLVASGAFAKVIAKMPPPQGKEVLAFFRNAAPLLAPAKAPADLRRLFLERSYGTFSTTGTLSLAEDPFGFASDHFRALPWPQAALTWQEGYLTSKTARSASILVILELRRDTAEYAAQLAVAKAVDQAESRLRQRHPDTSVSRLGGVFYAEAAQTGARHDTDLISIGSALGVVLLMLLVFRSVAMLATGLASIAAGVVGGAAAVLVVFGEIHLLTLVFGVSLIGEAADYSIQLVSAKLSDDEDGVTGWLGRVLPGLAMALGTSLLGYAAMTFVPLPSIRQIAVFAFTGLATAFVTVVLLGPAATSVLRGGKVSASFGELARKVRGLGQRLGPKAVWVGLLAVVTGLGFASSVRTDDDVRSLIHRPATLVAQEEFVAKTLGAGMSPQFILLHPPAGTDEACLRKAEAIRAQLTRCRESGYLGGWTSLGDIIPSLSRQEEALTAYRSELSRERTKLEAAFSEIGFTPKPGFWTAEASPLSLSDFMALPESAPFRHLRFRHEGKWCHLVTLRDVADVDQLRAAFADETDLTFVDKATSISRLLAQVRRQGPLWITLAFLLAFGVLGLRYGATRGAMLLLPTAIGVAWAPVLAGWAGVPFSVFGLMALLLVLGVGVNYSIFLWEGGARSKSALAGVIASCLTTLLSFGLLAFCSMPALSWLGTTLSIGILISFLLTPLALTDPASHTATPPPPGGENDGQPGSLIKK